MHKSTFCWLGAVRVPIFCFNDSAWVVQCVRNLRWTKPFSSSCNALSGIVVSFMSIFWTWGGGARLSRRLLRRPTSRIQAARMLRKAIDVGVSLNLIGMFLTLLGAEQTVGVLAIKVLTARPWNNPGSPFMASFDGSLQPLDILDCFG